MLAAGLLVGTRSRPGRGRASLDLCGSWRGPVGTLRDALARAWAIRGWRWATGSRRRAPTSTPPAGRLDVCRPGRGTPRDAVDFDGQRVAVVVHDAVVLDDHGLVEAVAAPLGWRLRTQRLQAEVRTRLAEVSASRRRLVQAGDDERRRLEQRLHDSAERRLAGLARDLEQDREGTATDSEAAERLRRAKEHLALTLDELRELAAGLHPRVLGERGLAGALAALAERSPVPVEVTTTGGRLPEEIEAAAYFVCSEGLANVAKYASASRAAVSVSAADGRVIVKCHRRWERGRGDRPRHGAAWPCRPRRDTRWHVAAATARRAWGRASRWSCRQGTSLTGGPTRRQGADAHTNWSPWSMGSTGFTVE